MYIGIFWCRFNDIIVIQWDMSNSHIRVIWQKSLESKILVIYQFNMRYDGIS
jgi:hypothetical protein